ncbi:MAG: TonB family protein [Bacteroidota bacterium]|jgi:TonB family protein|nr:TonB family protein [Bacteroidota bacterium]
MRTYLILLLFSSQLYFAQSYGSTSKIIKHDNILDVESKGLYDLGNIAFSEKQFDRADSLFTLSLKIWPHPDTYFNRAVCRRRMNDFSGYCIDLSAAANMNDKESYRLYCKECAAIDTIFTKANQEKGTIQDFEFASFITQYKYNRNSEYQKYNKRGELCLSYIIMGYDTIYLKSQDVSSAIYAGGNESIAEFIKTYSSFYKIVTQNKKSGKVDLALTIGSNGKVTRVKVLLGLRDGSSDTLARTLYKLAHFEPAKYRGREVKYQSFLTVEFKKSDLVVSDRKVYNKMQNIKSILPDSSKEVFTLVEEMPEFPGGPIQMMKFVQSNIVLPNVVKEKGIVGKCFLKFVVGDEGEVRDVEVVKGVPGCPECDNEAIRVVTLMPKWRPGTQNGKAVPVFFNLPINFQLK